jgi:STE24 endopeptidase
LRGTFFLAGIFSLQSLLHLPPALFATFRLEGKHGFNTMTWGLFWRDQLKGFILSALLGLPLIYAVLALMPVLGSRWWLWAFALIVAFQCVLLILFPVLIAPWFNRFRPLQDGELRDALFALAARLRFPAAAIQVMDGSRRSLHSNAYFTGFGRFRRIVLYDTLLQQMERPELLGILAHEIGHYKRQHIRIMLAGQILMLGLTLFLASLALRWPPLYAAFGFASHSDAAGTVTFHPFAGDPAVGLFLFLTVFSSFSLLFSPLRNLLSRRHEYQADAFAVAAIQDADSMQSALIKLSRHNLANLTPHPLYSAFHYSHPTLAERLAAIQGAGVVSQVQGLGVRG